MTTNIIKLVKRGILLVIAGAVLASCDVSTPTHTGDDSTIQSENLKKVSYSDLPGWRDDDVRYALQAFRNSCKAKIQYTGRIIPDRALFEESILFRPAGVAG